MGGRTAGPPTPRGGSAGTSLDLAEMKLIEARERLEELDEEIRRRKGLSYRLREQLDYQIW